MNFENKEIDLSVYNATKNLPDHDRVLKKIVKYFFPLKCITGAFISGSVASCTMDANSDIDVGVIINSTKDRKKLWKNRQSWMAYFGGRFMMHRLKRFFQHYIIISPPKR